MPSSLRLLTLALWSTVLLSERRLLGQYVAVNAEATLVPEFECTAAADGGRCDRIHDGSCLTRVREGMQKCASRRPIDLQGGCSCSPPPTFCDGEQARNMTADYSLNITYTVQYYQQFNVTASVKNLMGPGTWRYEMMMTGEKYGATVITGNKCACGSTDHREISISRTDDFRTDTVDGQHRSIHLCLRSGSSRVLHLVHNFSIGSSCLDFVNRHRLSSLLCNQPVGGIMPVNTLTVNTTSAPPALQVSWKKPRFLPRDLHGITYYLTLNSTVGIHTFTVSDSTNVTCTVRAGLNYTVTVRTWIWCEATSCRQQATKWAFVSPLLPTNTPTLSRTPPTGLTTDGMEHLTDLYSTNGMAVVIIVGSVLTVSLSLLLLFATVLVVAYCNWRIKKNRHSGDEPCCVESHARITNSCSTDSASTPHVDTISISSDKISDLESDDHTNHHSFPKQVLIVGSQRIPTEEHAQLVAGPLLGYKHNINILLYGVDTMEADRRLTPSEWVQQAMDRAEFVVCVCNLEFVEDWHYDRKKMCHEVSLVRTVSQHVAGLMNHGQNSDVKRKFITVVHCDDDLQYIPSNLRHCNSFILDCDANVERLARFLLEIPAVTFQRRDTDVDSIDHISSRL